MQVLSIYHQVTLTVVSVLEAVAAEVAVKVDKVVAVEIMVDGNVLVGSVIVNTAGVIMVQEELAVQVEQVGKVDEEMDIIGTAVIIGG